MPEAGRVDAGRENRQNAGQDECSREEYLMKKKLKIRLDDEKLEKIAWAPYDTIDHPSRMDWQRSYVALCALAEQNPEEGSYPNALGYICYYGRWNGSHSDSCWNGTPDYEEARKWFEKGTELGMIESHYKLADMLLKGLGGPEDKKRAGELYQRVYWYCRDQFEHGKRNSKFADTALRMGRLYHEGILPAKDDQEALSYLLEAKYAIEWRKLYDYYGDDTVEKNIRDLIEECEQPDDEIRKLKFYGMGLARVPEYLLPKRDSRMSVDLEMDDRGFIRLEFRKREKDGKKPGRILWSIAPAMKCFMTDFVVVYGKNMSLIWSEHPGETLLCDDYRYDETTGTHLFTLEGKPQLKLRGGEYVLPMDEFWMTEIRDHPEAGADIVQ